MTARMRPVAELAEGNAGPSRGRQLLADHPERTDPDYQPGASAASAASSCRMAIRVRTER